MSLELLRPNWSALKKCAEHHLMRSRESSPLAKPFSSGYKCSSQGDKLKSAWAPHPDKKKKVPCAPADKGERDHPPEVQIDIELFLGPNLANCSAELSGDPYEMPTKSRLSLHGSTLHTSGQSWIDVSLTNIINDAVRTEPASQKHPTCGRFVSEQLVGLNVFTKKNESITRIYRLPEWPLPSLLSRVRANVHANKSGNNDNNNNNTSKLSQRNLQLCVIRL